MIETPEKTIEEKVKKLIKDMTDAEILEEYFIEVKAGRTSVVRELCLEVLRQRLDLKSPDDLKVMFPEYFL